MTTIWKFHLGISPFQIITVPVSAKVLSAHIQDDKIMIWVRLNPSEPVVRRVFCVFPTGCTINDVEREYVGTVVDNKRNLVWHVFEEKFNV